MKKTFTYLCLALVCIVTSVSCNKAALDKDAVEAGFAAKGPVPTVTIGKISIDVTTASVSLTFAGISAESSDSLSIGLLTSNDPDFYTSNFAAVKTLADGTYTVNCSVTPNSKVYFRGVAANVNGTNYSETIAQDIPDVPFYMKVGGVYGCTEISEAYGDKYPGHSIYIAVDPEDNTSCIVGNIEPYFVTKGYVYTKGYNIVPGILDNEKKTITIELGADCGVAGFLMGALDSPSYKTAKNFTDIVLEMQADGSLLRKNCMVTIDPEDFSLYDAYAGGVVYRK